VKVSEIIEAQAMTCYENQIFSTNTKRS